MEEVQIGRRVKVQLTPIGSTIRCPKCHQKNFKVTTETCISNFSFQLITCVYMHNLTNDHMHPGK